MQYLDKVPKDCYFFLLITNCKIYINSSLHKIDN